MGKNNNKNENNIIIKIEKTITKVKNKNKNENNIIIKIEKTITKNKK